MPEDGSCLQLGEEFEIVEVIEDYSDDEDRSSIQIDINQSLVFIFFHHNPKFQLIYTQKTNKIIKGPASKISTSSLTKTYYIKKAIVL